MKKIHVKGKSVEEATEAALKIVGGSKENAVVRVISEGNLGILGLIGGEQAEIELTLKEGIAADAKQLLQDMLDKMTFITLVEIKGINEQPEPGQPKTVELEIIGDDMGLVIGADGAVLQSLETLVSAAINRSYSEWIKVSVDAGNYREKRQKALERLANEAANEVVQNRQEKVLPPMSAGDRRIIHLCLKNDSRVSTYSQGEGRARRLVIAPR